VQGRHLFQCRAPRLAGVLPPPGWDEAGGEVPEVPTEKLTLRPRATTPVATEALDARAALPMPPSSRETISPGGGDAGTPLASEWRRPPLVSASR